MQYNKLLNKPQCLDDSSGAGGLTTKNLVFWGDESSIDSGSLKWDNRWPYGLPDADLRGTVVGSYIKSGSVGFSFNGTNNYVAWNTGSFKALTTNDGLIDDGYTLSVTMTPTLETISYSGFGGGPISIYQPMALYSPAITPINQLGYQQMYINDACPGGGQQSYFINYVALEQGFERNTYYYNTVPIYNMNFTFVFFNVNDGYEVSVYLNGELNITSGNLNYSAAELFLQQFGLTNFSSTGDSSIADNRDTNCGGVSSNMPFTNYKGYVRDFLIYNRPLSAIEIYKNQRALDRWSEINNS
jgi:hypothetical protein